MLFVTVCYSLEIGNWDFGQCLNIANLMDISIELFVFKTLKTVFNLAIQPNDIILP